MGPPAGRSDLNYFVPTTWTDTPLLTEDLGKFKIGSLVTFGINIVPVATAPQLDTQAHHFTNGMIEPFEFD